MKQITTQGIILSRTDYAEADRILKFLTPDYGKVSAIAKGVRKSRSKLAGSIEFFSVSDLSFIVGRSDVYTITSARLVNNFDNIAKDLDRTQAAYDFIKIINKSTAEQTERVYFNLLEQALASLDNLDLNTKIVIVWFNMQFLKLSGAQPDLYLDSEGNKLLGNQKYNFDTDSMKFSPAKNGKYDENNIKFLRLGFASNSPVVLGRVKEKSALVDSALSFLKSLQSI